MRRNRVVASVVAVLALAGFASHSVHAWRGEVPDWDRDLSIAIHAYENRETLLDRFVNPLDVVLNRTVHYLGAFAALGVGAALFARGRRRPALLVFGTFVAASVLGIALKSLFASPPVDPGGSGYTFPSGHAGRTMALAGAFALVAWPTRWRWPVAIAGGCVCLVTGVAVVYHEWHWISDVLAGWYVALACLACVWLVLDDERVARRFLRSSREATGATA